MLLFHLTEEVFFLRGLISPLELKVNELMRPFPPLASGRTRKKDAQVSKSWGESLCSFCPIVDVTDIENSTYRATPNLQFVFRKISNPIETKPQFTQFV